MISAAGLRPSRMGGARIERENLPGKGCVIHNYGAGGTGYQAGMGMAEDAIKLADYELQSLCPPSLL
jgi:D-amino-acid oxidase